MDLGGCGPDGKRLPDGGPSQDDGDEVSQLRRRRRHANVDLPRRGRGVARAFAAGVVGRRGPEADGRDGHQLGRLFDVDHRRRGRPVQGGGAGLRLRVSARKQRLDSDPFQRCPPSSATAGCGISTLAVSARACAARSSSSTAPTISRIRWTATRRAIGWCRAGWTCGSRCACRTAIPTAGPRRRSACTSTACFRAGVRWRDCIRSFATEAKSRRRSAASRRSSRANCTTRPTKARWQKRNWRSVPAKIVDNRVVAELPEGRPLVCYLSVTDRRGAMVSTDHVTLSRPNAPQPVR